MQVEAVMVVYCGEEDCATQLEYSPEDEGLVCLDCDLVYHSVDYWTWAAHKEAS